MASISKQQLVQAHERITPHLHKTPVLTSNYLNGLSGSSLFFKCENLQKVGAFKARGALNAVLSLCEEERKKGVATHSSGNHGQALAYAANLNGIPSYIVVPRNAPVVKRNAMKDYGANLTLCEPNLQAREDNLKEIVENTGATVIHPYNDERIICGQATAAMELLSQVNGHLDYILSPVGGGGLLSGTCLASHYFSAETKIIGCEPEGADDAKRSLDAGEIIPMERPNTIADGLLTSLGDKTFPIIKEFVDKILTVNDEDIMHAMQLILQRMKLVIEPSAAVPLACLLKNSEMFRNKKVGIILSGGNTLLALDK